MGWKERASDEFDRRKGDILVFALLLGFGFFINRGIELKGLYMDDLYLWSCYGNQSFREFVFPMGSTRFRFVFYLAAWVELLFLGDHVTWMVPFNIILNSAIAFSMYRMARRFSGGRTFVSLLIGTAYLLSRFSYYQISQFYGLMESLGLWAALGVLYFLFLYVNGRRAGDYAWANLLYFLASFIHERYMALLPVLLLALLMGSRRGADVLWQRTRTDGRKEGADSGQTGNGAVENRGAGRSRRSTAVGRSRRAGVSRRAASAERAFSAASRRTAATDEARGVRAGSDVPKAVLFAGTAALFAVILLIRKVTIGTLSPAGTGGTDVADTFQLSDAIGHAWEQVGFVFGRNFGPDYLCGMPFADSPQPVQNMILAAEAVLALAVVVFFVCAARHPGRIACCLKNVTLFAAFIAFCIGSSSVTIRLEMRWIYVVYAAALLLLAYMTSVMGKAGALVFVYGALLFPVETFYRGTWENLYFWPSQHQYNSLAEQTVGKYGDDIFEKDVYIIGNTYGLSQFTAETFLKVYDTGGELDGKAIQFVDSDFDFKNIGDNVVLLAEDVEKNEYLDVTAFVKQQRFHRVYGSYDDGWTDENAKIVFMNGDSSRITLNCYYPGKITGNEVCSITVNGRRLADLVFTDNSMSYTFDSAPYQRISLELSCNFYVEDAKETRGEEKLAMILDIVAGE